jgi:hypothetical protein
MFRPQSFNESVLFGAGRIDMELVESRGVGAGFLCQVMDGDKMAVALVSNCHVFEDCAMEFVSD